MRQLADLIQEALAMLAMESIQIMPGFDRNVQTHINEVACDLDWMTHEIGYLPEDDGQAEQAIRQTALFPVP